MKKARDYPWSRFRRRVIYFSLVVFVAAPSFVFFMNWKNTERLKNEAEAIRAKGFPATVADLEKSNALPPKESNAADIYQKSFEVQKNAAPGSNYQDISKQFGTSPISKRFADALHQQMEGYLAANTETLRLLHEAAKHPVSRFPLDFSKGFAVPLPHLAKMRDSVRLLQIEAFVAAENGDTAKALEAVMAALAVSESVRHEPVVISQLVRNACDGITNVTINHLLSVASFSDQQLMQLQTALQQQKDPGMMTRALAGERALAMNAFENPETVLREIPEIRDVGMGAPEVLGGLVRLTGFANGDRSRYMGYMDQLIAASQLPTYEAIAAVQDLQERMAEERTWIPSLTDQLLPSLARLQIARAHDMAALEIAATGTAIERYQNANNRLPDQLEELVPAFLTNVPVDPFDGKPMRYLHQDTGYSIYCVGENLQDDGGRSANQGRDLHNGDVVFTVEHTSAP